MSTSVRPVEAHCDDDTLWVELSDGRTIGAPLAWFPRLLHATAEQRARVELTSRGLYWEELDEDIGLAGLLAGRGDQSRPPKKGRAA